jgi:hypothetical protein
LATSAAAAAVLARELGVPADNVHKFLHEHTHGPHAAALTAGEPIPASHQVLRLRPGDVILVDEAGMAGTLNLDRLVTIATRHGATVRLLGDYRQLAAVESGGALRLIATEVGAAELTTVHRFTNPAEAAATLKVRVGDSAGLDFYDDAGRIRGGSKTAMVEAAYRGWLTDMRAGVTSFMPAATNADAAALSARARADRVTAGQVEPAGVELHDGNTAGIGDWVVTRLNQRRLAMHGGRDWVRNGDPWHVTARHDDGSLRVRHLVHGGAVTLPAAYVTRHVELLYATTAHRVQGGTVDTAHPLVTDAMTREHLYVATTRARHRTTLYVATHDVLPLDDDERLDHAGHDPNARAAREVLHHILDRESAERSATETIRDTQHEAESLAVLIPRYLHAVKTYSPDTESESEVSEPVTAASPVESSTGEPVPRLGRYQYANTLGQALGSRLATRAVTDPAWPALQAAIHRTHQAGHDPVAVLPRVTRRRELDAAASVSAILAERITQVTTSERDPIRHGVTPSPDPVTRAAPLPWTPSPPSDAPTDAGQYLHTLAVQIRDRVAELGRTAAATRPTWSSVFGTEPIDPAARDHWESSISIVAAYREFRGITDDDPAHPLGPYLERGDPGHVAHRHAAAAILRARRLAHPETLAAPRGPTDAAGRTARAPRPTDGDTDHPVAVSVYRSLTPTDREVILTTMITTAGNLWHHRSGGHDPATDPLHGQQLRRALIRHGHLSQAPNRRPPPTTSAQSSIDPTRPPGRGTTNRDALRRPSAIGPSPLTSRRRGPIATPSDRKGADRVQTPRPSPVDPRLQRPGPPPAGPTTRR